jgi:hypothetical protein
LVHGVVPLPLKTSSVLVVNQPRSEARGFASQYGWRFGVDRVRQAWLGLCSIDGRVGGSVDNAIRRDQSNGPCQLFGSSEIAAETSIAVEIQSHQFTKRCERAPQFPADLASHAQKKQSHCGLVEFGCIDFRLHPGRIATW